MCTVTVTNISVLFFLWSFFGSHFPGGLISQQSSFALYWGATPCYVWACWMLLVYKAGLAQTTIQYMDVDHVDGPHAPWYLIGGFRSFVFSSSESPPPLLTPVLPLHSRYLSPFTPSSPIHICICMPARRLPAFYLLHPVFVSCRKGSLQRKFTQMSLWPLNPLILWTCNAVIMCDWRMKKGGGDMSCMVARQVKEKEGARKKRWCWWSGISGRSLPPARGGYSTWTFTINFI